jgi:hypothetical protein
MKRAFLVPLGIALAALGPQAAQSQSASSNSSTLLGSPAVRSTSSNEARGRLMHTLLALPQAARHLASAAAHVSHSSHASHASHTSHVSHASHVSGSGHSSHFSGSIPATPATPKIPATQAPTGMVVFKAKLTVGQEVPHPKIAGVGAIGHFRATLNGTRLTWTLTSSHLSGPAGAAEVRVGRVGANGPVLAALCSKCDKFETGAVTLTPAAVADLLAGRAYVNIHTKTNPSGEVRGQIRRG